MRKKTSLTIIEQAIIKVPAFKKMLTKLEQQVTLCGQQPNKSRILIK